MDNSLHEKLKAIENSLPEIEKQLSEIDISKDQKGYAEMAKSIVMYQLLLIYLMNGKR